MKRFLPQTVGKRVCRRNAASLRRGSGISLLLAVLLLGLSGCGAAPEVQSQVNAPESVPTEAPVATAEPVFEELPEEPGAGRIFIHIRDNTVQTGELVVACPLPGVTVALREEAEAALNEALQTGNEAFLSSATENALRTVLIPRQDKLVLSVLYTDSVGETRTVTGESFSTVTGERIEFSALTEDQNALLKKCEAYAAMTGVAFVSAVPEAGSWALSDEGLLFLLPGGEVTVPYAVLSSVLADRFMPPESEADRGILFADYSIDTGDALTLLDELTVAGGYESVIIRSRGSVRNVRAELIEGGERTLLWCCSHLKNDEAVRLNITVPETDPNCLLTWVTDSGRFEALLGRDAQTGKVTLLHAVG